MSYIQPKYKQLKAPTQRILYNDKPITDIIADKKIKLQTYKNAFMFILSIKQPNIIFLEYNGHITRINKLLKEYTQEEYTKQQFIKLLQEPTIIQDKLTTLFLLEIIYITSYLLNIDLKQFITNININNLIHYYFMLYKINNNKI